MRKQLGWAVGGVLTAVVAGLAFAAPMNPPDKPNPADKDKPAAAPDKPAEKAKDKPKEKPTTLKGRIAAEAKLSEDDVAKMLTAVGPVVRDALARGEKVELPGLGVLRVVRVAPHRDLVDGRPALIEASNYVEFVPAGNLVDAANAPGAVPQDTVLPFQYNPLPDQTKGLVMPDDRMPNVRVR